MNDGCGECKNRKEEDYVPVKYHGNYLPYW
jgi:hypothetical protein